MFEIKETAVSGTSLRGGNCIITHNLGLIWQKSIFDGGYGVHWKNLSLFPLSTENSLPLERVSA